MRKTLYIYLLREQLIAVPICLAGVFFVLLTGQLFQLMKILFSSSCTVWDLAEVVLLVMPRLAQFATPMAIMLGVMLVFVRLNGDNELIALRAAGTSFMEFLPPVLGVLIFATAVSFINSLFIIPASNSAFEMKIRSLGRASVPSILKEGVFVSSIPKLVFFFRSVDHSDMSMKGVFIQDQRQPNEQVTISAPTAQLIVPPDSKSITFQIANGVITRVPEHMQEAQAVSFKNYDFTISLDELLGRVERGIKKRNEMNLGELWESFKKSNGTLAAYYGLELYQRIAFPSACLLLGLIGPPLGALFRQRSRLTGITIGVGIFLAYYVLMTAGRGLAESNRISPLLAAWMPNLLCAVLAVYLWWKMQTEKPFIFERLISAALEIFPKGRARGKQPL